jgi:hypothetical protein
MGYFIKFNWPSVVMSLEYLSKPLDSQFIPVFTVLLILAMSAAATSSTSLEMASFIPSHQIVWAQSSELFPNSTLPTVLGNRSLIPGMHVMSLVNDVKPTWLIVSSDNELSVNLRHETTTGQTSPTVSLLATALKTTGGSPPLSSGVAYERATGTNITQAGWVSPISIPLLVEGTLSLYDADLIVVMIVPYTGPSLTNLTNTTTPVLPQDQNVT